MIDIQPPKCLDQLAQQCGPTGTRSIRRGSSDSLSALSQTVRVFLAATAVPAASALVSTAARSLAAAAYTGLTVAATPMCTLNKNCTPRTHGREQEGPAAANPSGAPRGLAGPFTATRATSTIYRYDTVRVRSLRSPVTPVRFEYPRKPQKGQNAKKFRPF